MINPRPEIMDNNIRKSADLAGRFYFTAIVAVILVAASVSSFQAQTLPDAKGTLTIAASTVVVSAQQRLAFTKNVHPKGIVGATGFDWPDTELGIIRNGTSYIFFGSDGSCHGHCGTVFERDGSITRTIGTLDNPLLDGSATETVLPQTPDLAKHAVIYLGGGAVYRVPAGHPGAGCLLLAYQAARNTNLITHDGMYGYIGLAKSTDQGITWTDLGLIIGANQPFIPNAPPATNEYDIGNGNLIADPTDTWLYIYFPDKLKHINPPGKLSDTYFSVARVGLNDLLAAAFNRHPPARLPRFTKYNNGQWTQPGIGGESSMILPGPYPPYAGDNFVAYSDFLHCYIAFLDDTRHISYATSRDGVHFSTPVLLKSFENEKVSAEYAVAIGEGADPSRLGQQFYIFFTYYPTDGTGWNGASLRRLTVNTH